MLYLISQNVLAEKREVVLLLLGGGRNSVPWLVHVGGKIPLLLWHKGKASRSSLGLLIPHRQAQKACLVIVFQPISTETQRNDLNAVGQK